MMSLFKRMLVIFFLISPLYAAEPTAIAQIGANPIGANPMGANPIGSPTSGSPAASQRPLIIGVDSFSPPFAMRGGAGELYGYDISMMNSLCKIIKRTCQFQVMKWVELMPAVMAGSVDIAVSSITITPERTKAINFTLPYALSYSRLLANKDTQVSEPLDTKTLSGKKIGVYKGTIYEDQATQMGISNPVIKTYTNYQDELKALTDKEVDFILLDNPTALYWAANSAGAFKVVGSPILYGFGIGIAVNKADKSLIPEINRALLEYQNSEDYHQNYKRYLDSF